MTPIYVSIAASIASILLILVVLELIRSRRLRERYALLWLATGIVLLVLSAWRGGLNTIAGWFGVTGYPPAVLFAVATLFILAVLLHYSTVISKLADQNTILAQRLALLEHRLAERSTGRRPADRPRVSAPEMSSSTGGRLERLTAFLGRNDRFFTPRMLASIGVYLVVAASYIQPRISDDGVIYYDFMRRLVGEDVPTLRLPVRGRLLGPPLLRPLTDRAGRQRRRLRRARAYRRNQRRHRVDRCDRRDLLRLVAIDPRARPPRRPRRDPPDRLRVAALLLRDLPARVEARIRRTSRLGAGVAPAPGDDPTSDHARRGGHRSGARAADLRPLREHRASGRGALRLLPPAVASPRVRGRLSATVGADRDPGAPAPAGDSVRSSPGRGRGERPSGWRLPPGARPGRDEPGGSTTSAPSTSTCSRPRRCCSRSSGVSSSGRR